MTIVLIGVICLMTALTAWALRLAQQQRRESLKEPARSYGRHC